MEVRLLCEIGDDFFCPDRAVHCGSLRLSGSTGLKRGEVSPFTIDVAKITPWALPRVSPGADESRRCRKRPVSVRRHRDFLNRCAHGDFVNGEATPASSPKITEKNGVDRPHDFAVYASPPVIHTSCAQAAHAGAQRQSGNADGHTPARGDSAQYADGGGCQTIMSMSTGPAIIGSAGEDRVAVACSLTADRAKLRVDGADRSLYYDGRIAPYIWRCQTFA